LFIGYYKMLAVIQRVSRASLHIDGTLYSSIQQGFLVLLGIHVDDTPEDVTYLAGKIAGLRIFSDEEGKMNLDLKAVSGELLLVSQFTLYAATRKGNRPSFLESARPEQAIPLYELMITSLSERLGKEIQTGVFGADMQINLTNDGPVTIIIDSKNP